MHCLQQNTTKHTVQCQQFEDKRLKYSMQLSAATAACWETYANLELFHYVLATSCISFVRLGAHYLHELASILRLPRREKVDDSNS